MTIQSITVRALETTDWEPLLAFELRNRTWFEQNIRPRENTFYCKVGVQKHIAELLHSYASQRWFPGLVLDSKRAIIGRTNLKDVDVKGGTAELGYRIAYDHVGKGVATQAVIQVRSLAQSIWNLQLLNAVVLPANLASIRVLEKCGFVRVDSSPSAPMLPSDALKNTYQCQLGPPII